MKLKNKYHIKTSKKIFFAILLFFVSGMAMTQEKNIHSFKLDKEEFLLDGKPFQIISGEIHPARVPAEYWRHRIQMAKAMGCNTIAAYIFWNYHETSPGVFDFKTENRNIREFIKIAQEEGMWVLLRPGPYVCAEWDFGGLPSYLLSIPDIKVRCMDSRYTEAVERYIKTLALQVNDLQVSHGGPILMVQIENEYGSYGNDKAHLSWLKELWEECGIDVPFYTSDGATPRMLEAGTLPEVAIGLDPGSNAGHFKQAYIQNPDVPSFCSELYPGWLTHWGEEWQGKEKESLLKDVKWLMDNKKSFNFYVIHGGTNFGFWAGANAFSPDEYMPDITSYDYGAPINEMGQPTENYYALRDLLKEYLPKGQKMPDIPEPTPVITIPEIKLTSTSVLWENLPKPEKLVQPKPMEMLGQKSGFILYRTTLLGDKKGELRVTELHDYATVFLDGKYIGTLDRTKAKNTIEIPESENPNPQLDILVEGMGRINFAQYMIDRKGITDHVSLNRMTLMNWDVYCLPFDCEFIQNLKFKEDIERKKPGMFFKGKFNLENTGDTYLDVSAWKKGVVWVNGHNLGRYWEIGPQQRLYCPATWLKEGENEIIVFDMHQTEPEKVTGEKTLKLELTNKKL